MNLGLNLVHLYVNLASVENEFGAIKFYVNTVNVTYLKAGGGRYPHCKKWEYTYPPLHKRRFAVCD